MEEKEIKIIEKEYEEFLKTETGKEWKKWHELNTKEKGSLNEYIYNFYI